MAEVSVMMRTDAIRKDGTAQLYIRCYLAGKYALVATDVYALPKHWNEDSAKINGGEKPKEKNLILQEMLGRASDIILKYRVLKKTLTAEIFKQELLSPENVEDFIAWAHQEIDRRRGKITDSTRKQHHSTFTKLGEWKNRIGFHEVNAKMLEEYEKYLKLKLKNNPNTIYGNLKNIRTYLNRAEREGLITTKPFKGYKLPKQRSMPEFLTEEERDSVMALYMNNSLPESYKRVARWFLFSCFTGLRISDLRAITHENIRTNWLLRFRPVKTSNTTGALLELPLTKTAQMLIHDECPGRVTGPLFDMLSDQRINRYLKDVLKAAGIKRNMSMHSGRHTFATIFLRKYKNSNGLMMLKQLLGHADMRSTMIYAHLIQEDIITAMQDFES